jgi:2-polyprenyl-6-methoxyphenol hydroxylase-like FAD-dependent oxidoreductase
MRVPQSPHSTRDVLDIVIFGAGIAGLASAIALSNKGHRCRVYERNRAGQDAGMGFILVPEVRQRLQALGVRAAGVPLRNYLCRNQSGEVVYTEEVLTGTSSVLRRDFINALMSAFTASEAVRFDHELQGFEFDAAGRVAAAHTTAGKITADLYVAADGTRSRGRSALFPQWPARPAGVQEIVGLARCPQTIRWAAGDFNKFFSANGGLGFGVLQVDADHVVWYVQFDSLAMAAPEGAAARRKFVESLVGDWAEPVPHLVASTDFERVHLWRPIDADLLPRFYRHNLVLVGDAAHPLSPFTSQGVSAAVADAVSLAEALESADGSPKSMEQALEDYSRQRRQACAPYIEKGREFRQKFLEPLAERADILPIAYTP